MVDPNIFFLTDLEGRLDKLIDAAQDNPAFSLHHGQIVLMEGWTLIFGGDITDRGPHTQALLRIWIDAYDRYPGRVILLAGNRDINKLRLPRELGGFPRSGAPVGTREDILKWTLEKTMGAPLAYRHAQDELGVDGDVSGYFLALVAVDPEGDGLLLQFLRRARLIWSTSTTIFVHGAVTEENLGLVPGGLRCGSLGEWQEQLNGFYQEQLDNYRRNPMGLDHQPLISYQAPLPGTRLNQESVVYGRPTDGLGNPQAVGEGLVARLRNWGISRVVVGHTPVGATPALVVRGEFVLVLADNSHGRPERGSQVFLESGRVWARGWAHREGGVARVRIYEGDAAGKGEGFRGCFEDGVGYWFRFEEDYRPVEKVGEDW